jgi:hypothetical protein
MASTSPVNEAEQTGESAADVSVEPRESVAAVEKTESAEVHALGTPQPAPVATDETSDTSALDAAKKKQATKKQATRKQATKAAKKQPAKKDTARRAPRRRM